MTLLISRFHFQWNIFVRSKGLLILKLSLFTPIEALKEAKMLYFTDAEENMEPVNSLHVVVDGTMKAIGHLFVASICNYGPAPSFLSTWIFNYIV